MSHNSSDVASAALRQTLISTGMGTADCRKIEIPLDCTERQLLKALRLVWKDRTALVRAYNLATGDLYCAVTSKKPRGGLAFLIKFFGSEEEARKKYGHIRNCASVARRFPLAQDREGKSWAELSGSVPVPSDWQTERRTAHDGHGELLHHYAAPAFGKYSYIHIYEYQLSRVVEHHEKRGIVRATVILLVDVDEEKAA